MAGVPKEGPGSRTGLTVARVVAALKATRGRKQLAAERLGVNWRTMHRFCQAHPSVEEVIQEERERRIDRAVIANDALVASGFFPAVRWTLATLGKHEGWTEKIEVESNQTVRGDPNAPITLRVVYDEPLVLPEHAANGHADA